MSRRKRYRKIRNKAVKDNFAAFSANRRKHREEREAADAQEQLGRARLMYDKFKEELCSESRTAPQVIADFEAFKDVIRRIVKVKYVQKTILAELNFAELKFLTAYGPKNDARMAQWREEAKKLRTSNRRKPEPPVIPENN